MLCRAGHFQSEPKTELSHLVLRMSEGHNSPLTAQTHESEAEECAAEPGALAGPGRSSAVRIASRHAGLWVIS